MAIFEDTFRNQLVSASFSMLDGEDKLVERAVRGEAPAFGFLYDHYQPKIYRFVLIKVSHREEAEDLTHQVFLQAWQNIKKYTHRGFPFSSWLYRIARNVVIDHYRAAKPVIRLEDEEMEKFSSEDILEATTERRIILREAMNAIRALKPEYQDVVIMRFVEELSIKETAEALGKSEGATKLLQHRALRALKRTMPDSSRFS